MKPTGPFLNFVDSIMSILRGEPEVLSFAGFAGGGEEGGEEEEDDDDAPCEFDGVSEAVPSRSDGRAILIRGEIKGWSAAAAAVSALYSAVLEFFPDTHHSPRCPVTISKRRMRKTSDACREADWKACGNTHA